MTTYISALRKGIDKAMQEDKHTILIGEDIRDPFGGVSKVTRGFTKKYPNRVINTPISEAGIVGLATGLSMQGFKPIVEIMFYDFMTLVLDQLLNHALKFKIWGISPNITIRTMIGKREYGVVHCQNLNEIFSKIMPVHQPGLESDVTSSFLDAFHDPRPTLFVEERDLYTKDLIRRKED